MSAEQPSTADPSDAAPWVVAAMAKNVFLRATDSWADRLSRAGQPTVDLRADRARRADLVEAFGAGPAVVLYAGHGRPRGWAGYQALRIDHLRPEDARRQPGPVGAVIAFACSTLDRGTDRVPFGQLVVDQGIARCYLAPTGPVVTAEAEELADVVVRRLCHAVTAEREYQVADLIREVDHEVGEGAGRAWATFEAVGDTSTQIR